MLASGQKLVLACANCTSPFLSIFDENMITLQQYDLQTQSDNAYQLSMSQQSPQNFQVYVGGTSQIDMIQY